MINLKREYARVNRKWFDNKLPTDMIVKWSHHQYELLGGFHPHGYKKCEKHNCRRSYIMISSELKRYDAIAFQTLVHEMVHVKGMSIGNRYMREFHGHQFHAEMHRLTATTIFEPWW